MSSLYTVGQMNRLADSLEGAGFTPGDITKLSQFSALQALRAVLDSRAEIVQTDIVDLNRGPFIPGRWGVMHHLRQGEQFEWDPNKFEFELMPELSLGTSSYSSYTIHGCRGYPRPSPNACLLDHLLKHPYLIPEKWKQDEQGNTLCSWFWGTVYDSKEWQFGSNPCVRFLYWNGVSWKWGPNPDPDPDPNPNHSRKSRFFSLVFAQ